MPKLENGNLYEKQVIYRNSLVGQQVKDLALSHQQLGLLLWRRFAPWPGLPRAVGVAKKINKIKALTPFMRAAPP